MEGASLLFSVDSAEASEDEDDVQRKQELHQLLSEQLQDDLLDDTVSVAMSESGDVSPLSSPEGFLSLPSPSFPHRSPPSSSSSHPRGRGAGEQSDVFRGTSQEYLPPESLTVQSSPVPPLSSRLPAAQSQAPPTQGLQFSASHFLPLHNSDSQQEGLRPETLAHSYPNLHSHPPSHLTPSQLHPSQLPPSQLHPSQLPPSQLHPSQLHPSQLPPSQLHSSQLQPSHHPPSQQLHPSQLPPSQLPPSQPHYSLAQLMVLYAARGRRLKQLTDQLHLLTEQTETRLGALRHEKTVAEEELDRLRALVERQEAELGDVRSRLSAESEETERLAGEREDLCVRLQGAETTLQQLSRQVEELSGGEAVSRVRESYSSALTEAAERHQREVLALQQELEDARGVTDREYETVRQLQDEVIQLHEASEQQTAVWEGEIESLRSTLAQTRQEAAEEEGLVRAVDLAGEKADRLVELSARSEDLQFRLTSAEGELSCARRLVESLEAELREAVEKQAAVQSSEEELRRRLGEAGEAAEREREGKRTALEECRRVCLKLHEDASARLQEAMDADKQRLSDEHAREVARLRGELSAVQEEYVTVCRKRDEAERNGEEGGHADVKRAVEEAQKRWQCELESESRASVQSALRQWEGREEEWRRQARRQWEQEKESAVSAAVRLARGRWLAERETCLQARVEAAVAAAQRLWRQHHRQELQGARPEVKGLQVASTQTDFPLPSQQLRDLLRDTLVAVKKDLKMALLEVREGEEAEVEEILQSAGNYRPHRHEGEAVARGNQRLPREILQSTGNHRPHRHEGEAVARGNQQSPRGRGGGRGRTGDSC